MTTETDLLDFSTPKGFRLHTASFAAEQFTAAATLSALPVLDGSIAYSYTSKPLRGVQGTAVSPLINLVQAFREVKPAKAPDDARFWEIWQGGRRVDFRGEYTLLPPSSDCRHALLWKNVSSYFKIRGYAYSSSLPLLAMRPFVCLRPKACSWKCCGSFISYLLTYR